MAFAFLMCIPLLVAVCGFILFKTITWQEFGIQVVTQAAVAGLSAFVIYQANTYDVEIYNGYVTGKKQVYVHCRHSYRCRCHTSCSGSGSSRHCSEHCSTCYRHSNDWDWEVYNSIGETFDINTIDSRGSIEPPRWTSVKQGDPTSTSHSYTNYIKAAPDTLFRHQGLVKKYEPWIPEYPGDVFDYYRLNRLVLVNGAKVDKPKEWNAELSLLNARLGARKEVNVIVVVVKDLDAEYFEALEEAWIGGKNNDTILVVGVNALSEPKWARVMAWTRDERIKIDLRNDIADLPKLELASVMGILQKDVEKFYQRKPMSDFEYLSASVAPTGTQWVISLLFGLMIACGLTYVFHRNDFSNPYNNMRGRRYGGFPRY